MSRPQASPPDTPESGPAGTGDKQAPMSVQELVDDDALRLLTPEFLHPRYWGTWAVMGLLRLTVALPYSGRVAVGRALGGVLYRIMTKRRHIARVNLGLCFPELAKGAREDLLKAHFAAVGVAFIEMGATWWVPDHRLENLAEIRGMEHLKAALAKGRGAILLSAHFTAMEMGLRLFSRETGCYVIYRPNNNPLIDRIIQRGRTQHRGRMISRDDVRSLLGGLKKNHPVWYPPDQDYGRRHSVFVDFFGQPAATITTTARYAKMSKAPVLPFYMYRKPGGAGYQFVLKPPLDNFPSGNEVDDARRVNKALEEGIREHPEQYLWVHRRFKTRPESGQNPYQR